MSTRAMWEKQYSSAIPHIMIAVKPHHWSERKMKCPNSFWKGCLLFSNSCRGVVHLSHMSSLFLGEHQAVSSSQRKFAHLMQIYQLRNPDCESRGAIEFQILSVNI